MEPEKDTTITQAEAVQAPVETTTKEETIGEVMTPADTKQPETVGLDKFLDEKKGRKQAEKDRDAANAQIADLQAKIAEGGVSKKEISSDLKSIAEKYDIEPDFMSDLSAMMEKRAEEIAEEKIAPMKEGEKQKHIDETFKKHFDTAMERMPEYDGIVNAEVIKTLSLNPSNHGKTFSQLIEETYGNAVTGKRTFEPTKPGGGKEPAALDIDRARKDTEYFKEVMSDPKLKAEYNKAMLERTV